MWRRGRSGTHAEREARMQQSNRFRRARHAPGRTGRLRICTFAFPSSANTTTIQSQANWAREVRTERSPFPRHGRSVDRLRPWTMTCAFAASPITATRQHCPCNGTWEGRSEEGKSPSCSMP